MKTRTILYSLFLSLFLASCCNCDTPTIYSITDDELAIFPPSEQDSIHFKDDSENDLLAHSEILQGMESGRHWKCGFGKPFACNCRDDEDDSRTYAVYFNDNNEFRVELEKSKNGLTTRFLLNSYDLTQTATLQNIVWGSTTLQEVYVFKWEERSSRTSVDGNSVTTPEIWYAPGVGVIKIAFSDGIQWEQYH